MWNSPRRRHWYCPPTSRSPSSSGATSKAWACRLAASCARASRPMPSMRDAVPVKYLSTSSRVQADRLEDLRAAIALQGRDPHLGHDLEDALVGGLEVVVGDLARLDAPQLSGRDQLAERLEREVGVHRAGAVADEQREVHDLARLPRLDDEAATGAGALADEVVVDRGGREQARDRRVVLVDSPVGEDEDRRAVLDRGRGLPAEDREGLVQARGAVAHPVEHRNGDGAQGTAPRVP